MFLIIQSTITCCVVAVVGAVGADAASGRLRCGLNVSSVSPILLYLYWYR